MSRSSTVLNSWQRSLFLRVGHRGPSKFPQYRSRDKDASSGSRLRGVLDLKRAVLLLTVSLPAELLLRVSMLLLKNGHNHSVDLNLYENECKVLSTWSET